MQVSILNCTPHAVRILNPDCCEYDRRTRSYSLTGEPVVVREIAPSGCCPRCSTRETEREPLDSVPVVAVEYGEIENLPEPVEGTWLVVSAIVATAGRSQGRHDLLVPTRMVRDASGAIVGCLALASE